MKKNVPVTTRALVQRLNRALAAEGEMLKSARGAKAVQDLGDYYILNTRSYSVARKNVDIVDLARKLGALKPFEVLS